MTRLHWLTAAVVAALATSLSAGRQAGAQAEEGDLRGVVRSPAGAEAGVWVIAETDELDTRFRKIVVTGDDGVNDREIVTNSRHSSVRSARAPVFSCGS